MTDATNVVPSKPAATSLTLQGAVLQFIISATALVVLFFPKEASTINSVSQSVQNYLPVVLSVLGPAIPLVMTVIGRLRAHQPLV